MHLKDYLYNLHYLDIKCLIFLIWEKKGASQIILLFNVTVGFICN